MSSRRREGPPEARERLVNREKSSKGMIHSYLDVSSKDQLVIKALEALEKRNPREHKHALSELRVQGDSAKEKRTAVEARLSLYEKKVGEVKSFLPTHLPRIEAWLEKENLTPKQRPESIPVFVADHLLYPGVPAQFPRAFGEKFDPSHNGIFVSPQHGNNVLAHEYVHGMSFDRQKQTGGFCRREGKRTLGNTWLDEAVTMIGEFATYPTKARYRRDEPDDLYEEGYFWLMQEFQKALGISEAELLHAYFGEEPFRSQLEEKTRKRFGCSIEKLDDVFWGSSKKSKEQTLKILKGEPVSLQTYEGMGLEEKYTQLQRLFPHMSIVVKARPHKQKT